MATQTILESGVREDLVASHVDTIADLSRAGDFLRADEKVALMRVVRSARAESERPPWYEPTTEERSFDPLAAAAVDAAWRLTNHPGTLTPEWYAATVEQLPSAEYYTELVGVVAVTNSIDRFAAVLDLDELAIPEPMPGEPQMPVIETAVSSHWVPTAIDFQGPNVLRAFSAAPDVAAMRTRLGAAQYMDNAGRADRNYSRGTLDRRQIELVAGVTSLHNECFY